MVCAIVLFTGQTAVAARDIAGQVVDAQTGEPIGRARVTVRVFQPAGQSAELLILTDAAGRFTVTNVPDGNCQVSCQKAGYVGSNETSEWMRSVTFSGDSKPASVVLRLIRQAVIEGSVIDEKGDGVPFASIQAYKPAIVEGRRRMQNTNGRQADEKGEFRLFGLAAGRYYLGVTASASGSRRSKTFAYPPVLYPNATDITGALPIDLQPGQEEHVQVRLQAVPAHEIRGRVSPAGRHVSFSLRPQHVERLPLAPNFASAWNEKAQTFTIRGVTSGVYVLEASTGMDGQWRRALTTIAVDNADIEGIRLEPGSLPAVTGNVRAEEQETAPRAPSWITIQSPANSLGVQIDAEGNFRVNDVPPDTYRVVLSPGGSFYVRSIRQGGRDVLRDGLVITSAPPEPLEIVLGSHGATIEGYVTVPNSDPPVPVVVALLRAVGDDMILEKQVHLSGSTAPNTPGPVHRTGQFTMHGVPPGDYVLFVWPQGAQIEYANPEIMRQYHSSGKAISVTEGAKVSVNLDRMLPMTER